MVTGIVMAIYGHEPEGDRGKFLVEDYTCRELASQVERPLATENSYVLLLSGLELQSVTEDSLATQLLIEMITGHAGSLEFQRQMSKITRVIIAGQRQVSIGHFIYVVNVV